AGWNDIGAIVCLDPFAAASRTGSLVEDVRGARAVMALARNTWGTRLLPTSERAAELDLLTRLADQSPVRSVGLRCSYPAELVALADRLMHDVIAGTLA